MKTLLLFAFLAGAPHGTAYDSIPTSSLDLAGTVRFSHSSVSADTNTSTSAVVFIGVDDTSAPRTVTLQTADAVSGRVVIVVDESNAAGTNAITIATQGAETISGSASMQISENGGWLMLYSDGSNWFVWGRGPAGHGQMTDTQNTDVFTVNAASQWHSYHTNGLVGSELDSFTFEDGGAGTALAVSAVADGGGGEIAVTTATHGLAVNDIVSMTNCADAAYNGIFVVNTINSTTEFEVTAVYTATDAACIVDRAAMLEAGVGVSGDFLISWTASAAGKNANDVIDWALYKNATKVAGSEMRRTFGGIDVYGAMGGTVLNDIADGDKISFAFQNISGSGNVTVRSLTVLVHKL